MRFKGSDACLEALLMVVTSSPWAAAKGPPQVDVLVGSAAPELERFAASELCDYLVKLFRIQAHPARSLSASGEAVFVIGSPETNAWVKQATGRQPFPKVSDQGIVLRRTELEGRPALIVGGGSPRATLWAVYELVERWGVRYLVDRDVLPEEVGEFKVPDLDVVMEPTFRIRAHPTIQDLVASGEAWGMADFRPLIDQLSKLKFTRLNIYTFGWQPYLHWEFKGIKRRSASLWYDYHYPITPNTVGRELFGDVSEFWNPDLPLTSSYQELVQAGERLVHNLIEYAHRRGMECAVAAPVTDFPPEFAPLLKGAEQSHQLAGLTVVPGEKTTLDDPGLFELSSAMLQTLVNTYPEADLITVFMPEFRQWIGEYERAWAVLDGKYGIGKVRSLSEVLSAAERRKGWEGGAQRALNEVKGDIASLYFYDRLLRDSEVLKRTHGKELRIKYLGVAEELFPLLDQIFPSGWEMGSMPSNQPTQLLQRIEILKDLPTRVPGILNLTLDDDNIGVMPQMTTTSLHKIVQVMKRHGWSGITARERFPGDHDWPLAYLSKVAWDPTAEPDAVALDQLRAVCGEECAAEMLAAFHEVEAVTIAFAPTAFAFAADWPPSTSHSPGGMLMKHWRWAGGAMPEYLVEARQGYGRALQAAQHAQAKATPAGRNYVDFWVGRLEFAALYVEAVQAIQRAAAAQAAKNRAQCVKEAETALTTLRRAIEAYARVARNQTDRAAIALLNKSYRELAQRKWSIQTWGY